MATMPVLDHVAFQTADMDRAIDFYQRVLGFKLLSRQVNQAEGEAYTFMQRGELRLELLQNLRAPFAVSVPVPPYCPHLALVSDDMAATLKQLRDSEVELLRGPLEVPGEETWLYFTDPDGNVIEFIQWFHQSA